MKITIEISPKIESVLFYLGVSESSTPNLISAVLMLALRKFQKIEPFQDLSESEMLILISYLSYLWAIKETD